MKDSNEWYQEFTRSGWNGEMLRWIQVSTVIPTADIPGHTNTSDDQATMMVVTWWYEESNSFVVTLVMSKEMGRSVMVRDVDGSDRTALELEHRRIVNLIQSKGTNAIVWS